MSPSARAHLLVRGWSNENDWGPDSLRLKPRKQAENSAERYRLLPVQATDGEDIL
jgi:hypothetical protein